MYKKWLLTFAVGSLFANPTDPTVVGGEATMSSPDISTLHIRCSDKAIIEWKDFSIGENELTRFIQPQATSAVLNRVTTGNPSHLLGRLEANGFVYLINPNGIFAGEHSSISTNSFCAFTFDLSNDVFLRHDFAGGALFSKPEGSIRSDNPFSHAIQYKGELDAFGSEERGGRIYLVADKGLVEVSGQLHASGGEVRVLGENVALTEMANIDVSGDFGGGTVLIGGDYQGANSDIANANQTCIVETASIAANARLNGDGGKVIVWADNVTGFYGNIDARGGEQGGNGGFVEVSGKKYLDFRGVADRSAPLGEPGTLLLDPINITIGGGDLNVTLVSPLRPTASPATLSNLAAGALQTQLGLGPVIVESSGAAGPQNGDINIVAMLNYTSGNNLTFRTRGTSIPGVTIGNIHVFPSGPISNAGNGSIIFDSINDVIIEALIAMGVGATGSISVRAENNITLGTVGAGTLPQLTADLGSVTVNAVNGNVLFQGGSGFGSFALINAGAPGISIFAGNDLTLTSGMADNATAQINCPSGPVLIRVGGDIVMQATTAGFMINSVTINSNTLDMAAGGDLRLIGAPVGAVQSTQIAISAVTNALIDVNDVFLTGGSAGISSGATIAGPGPLTLLARNVSLQGGSGPASFARIFNPTITVTATGDVTLNAGTGAGSVALIGGATSTSVTADGQITLNGSATEFATIGSLGASTSTFSRGDTQINFNGRIISSSAPALSVTSLANVVLNDNGTINHGAGAGTLTVNALNNVLMNDTSTISHANGAVSVFAGVDINMTGTSSITSGGGALNLIVDNLFPTPPGIGLGAFIMASGTSVSSGGGPLRIFTARQPLNSVLGLTPLNGLPFSPGTEFNNTSQERWGVYFFNSFGGSPFTIFYKDFQLSPAVIANFQIPVFEFFQRLLFDYDYFWYWEMDFTADRCQFSRNWFGGKDALKCIDQKQYHMLRKSYKENNGKIVNIL